jgi:hypothetical protein
MKSGITFCGDCRGDKKKWKGKVFLPCGGTFIGFFVDRHRYDSGKLIKVRYFFVIGI